MKPIEEVFPYTENGVEYEIEIEYAVDKTNFYPVKTTVAAKVSGGKDYLPIIFSNITFGSKEDCVDFLMSEARKLISSIK